MSHTAILLPTPPEDPGWGEYIKFAVDLELEADGFIGVACKKSGELSGLHRWAGDLGCQAGHINHRPGLLEHLAELYPNHIQFHYGQYKRVDLIEAARRSRACAYLADDDHGPLALQDILLAGCPTVGVRTGASFVRDRVTGSVVDRLPPGRQCVENDFDQIALAVYLHG